MSEFRIILSAGIGVLLWQFTFYVIRLRILRRLEGNIRDVLFLAAASLTGIPYQARDIACRIKAGIIKANVLISLPAPGCGHFQVRRISWPSRERWLYRLLPFCRGLSTGDENFDSWVHLRSYTPEFALKFFDNDKNRKVCQRLLDSGFDELRYDGEKLELMGRFDQPDEIIKIEHAEKILSDLSFLAGEIEKHRSTAGQDGWKMSAALAPFLFWLPYLLLPVSLVMAFIVLFFTPLRPNLANATLLFSLPIALAYTAAWIYTMSGVSINVGHVIGFGLSVVFSFALFLATSAIVFNGYHDKSPIVEHRVIASDFSKDSESRTSVIFPSWLEDQDREKLHVSGLKENEQILPNRTAVIVKTKAGRLGYEWVVSCRVDPASPLFREDSD